MLLELNRGVGWGIPERREVPKPIVAVPCGEYPGVVVVDTPNL